MPKGREFDPVLSGLVHTKRQRDVPIVLTARNLGFKDNLFREKLGGIVSAVSQLLANPNKVQEDKEEFNCLYLATTLPPDAEDLQSVWQILHQELISDTHEGAAKFLRYTTAALLAHSFLHQSGLILAERAFLKTVQSSYGATEGAQLALTLAMSQVDQPVGDAAIVAQVTEDMGNFKNVFTKRMKQQPANIEETREQIAITNGLINIPGGSLYIFWNFAASDDFKDWYKDLTMRAFAAVGMNPLMDKLLSEGKLKDVNPRLEGIAWVGAMSRAIQSSIDESGSKELMEYFLSRRDLQNIFWGIFASDLSLYPAALEQEELAEELINSTAPGGRIIERVFNQDQKDLEVFLQTIQSASSGWGDEEQTIFLKNLIGLIGVFKGENPEHPNASYLGSVALKDVSSALAGGRDRVSKLLGIVADDHPGILYLTPQGDVRIREPQNERSQEGFIAAVKRDIPIILYTSRANMSEPAKSGVRGTKNLEIAEGEKQFLPGWGEVQIISPFDTPKLTEWLTDRLDIAQDKALEWVLEYKRKMLLNQREAPLVLLLDLLGEAHPLSSALNRLGIVGIEQEGSRRVMLLIDSDRAGIKTPSKRLLLTGEVSDDLELMIPGSAGIFDYSAAHLTLNAAVLMARGEETEYKLENGEVSGIRSLVKSWNRGALRASLPQLAFDLAANERSALQTVTFVKGRKSVLLNLVDRR